MMAKDELETVLDLDSQRLDTLTSMVRGAVKNVLADFVR